MTAYLVGVCSTVAACPLSDRIGRPVMLAGVVWFIIGHPFGDVTAKTSNNLLFLRFLHGDTCVLSAL